MRKKIKTIILESVLIIFSIVFMIPVIMMILGSFKSSAEAGEFNLLLPKQWLLNNYTQVFNQADVGRAFLNGIIYSVIAGAVICLSSAMAAFIIVRAKRKYHNTIFNIFVIGMILPPNMVTSVFLLKSLNIYGTYLSMILIYAAWAIPLTVFIYSGFIKNLNKEIDEAAIIDGCNITTLFFKIIFPVLSPVNFTAAIIAIMGVWNDFTAQLYFTGDSSMWSMPMTIYKFYGMYSRDWNLVFADLVLTTVPIAIVFLAFQKYIITGMTSGSVKG